MQELERIFHQIAYVTNDMERAKAEVGKSYGISRYRSSDRELSTIYRGEEGTTILKTAIANLRGLQVEIVEPRGGQADIYWSAIGDQAGFCLKFHHCAFRVGGSIEQFVDYVEALERAGSPVCWSPREGARGGFVYIDERSTLGHFVEYIWLPPHRLEELATLIPFND